MCWPAVSLSGIGTVVQQTARPSSEQWTQLQRSSVPLSPPSWTFFLHDAPVKLPVSWRTPPIPPTVSSSSYHQEDGSGASEPTPPDCSTAFSHRLWEPWTKIPPPLSETPYKPPASWNMDHGPWSCEARRFVPLYNPHNKVDLTWLIRLRARHQNKNAVSNHQTAHIYANISCYFVLLMMDMLCELWCLNHTCKLTFQPGKFWWHFLLILPPYKACNNVVFTLCNGYNYAVPKHKEWICTCIYILRRTVLWMLIWHINKKKKYRNLI